MRVRQIKVHLNQPVGPTSAKEWIRLSSLPARAANPAWESHIRLAILKNSPPTDVRIRTISLARDGCDLLSQRSFVH